MTRLHNHKKIFTTNFSFKCLLVIYLVSDCLHHMKLIRYMITNWYLDVKDESFALHFQLWFELLWNQETKPNS